MRNEPPEAIGRCAMDAISTYRKKAMNPPTSP
jgi:hypothetical protein